MPMMQLAVALGLRPLDRVMIVSQTELREVANFRRLQGRSIDLPYWFFQFVDAQGRLVLRAPGGSVTAVSPHDVCDVIPGAPIKVMAMPSATWAARARLSLAERQRPPGPECYAPASVLFARRDRWGRFEYLVRFDEEALNTPGEGTTRLASLLDEDQRALQARTRRTVMPVTSWPCRGTSWSADQGVDRAQAIVRADAAAFVGAALSGNKMLVDRLAFRDAAGLTSKRAPRRQA